jgi:hypothetical protein
MLPFGWVPFAGGAGLNAAVTVTGWFTEDGFGDALATTPAEPAPMVTVAGANDVLVLKFKLPAAGLYFAVIVKGFPVGLAAPYVKIQVGTVPSELIVTPAAHESLARFGPVVVKLTVPCGMATPENCGVMTVETVTGVLMAADAGEFTTVLVVAELITSDPVPIGAALKFVSPA